MDKEVFAGGVAVITGAGSGLGAGLARRAAELGMRIVAVDISKPGLEAIAADIRARGAEALTIAADVSKADELDRVAAQVHESWGDVRLLINNAGIETIGFTWEIPAARWDQTLNININGIIHGVRAFAPRMLEVGKPAYIANLASIGAFGVMPAQTAYIVTKHAIQAFSECLYLEMELSGKPIHVSSVIPGMVRTNIFAEAPAAAGEAPHAKAHRKYMREMMAAYGMDLADASKVILEQIAKGEFWVSTQPEMTRDMIAGRIAFLSGQTRPPLAEQARAIIEGSKSAS
ncbi:MAG: SDR family NAD(P)-dependent oxidoreductase [Hyphomonadaceae bacterium]|nr:SDR family NAD(P)-dependent oxidoreductase [Hyphomonadaceae bacterium]